MCTNAKRNKFIKVGFNCLPQKMESNKNGNKRTAKFDISQLCDYLGNNSWKPQFAYSFNMGKKSLKISKR